jgi:hypothetical protein
MNPAILLIPGKIGDISGKFPYAVRAGPGSGTMVTADLPETVQPLSFCLYRQSLVTCLLASTPFNSEAELSTPDAGAVLGAACWLISN